VSKQVKIMETAGILTKEKEGRWIYYSLNQHNEAFLDALFESVALIEDINEQLAGDQRRFEARMKLREDGRCKVGILQKELTTS
ncbi:MAG: ArsR/SmtB family transcription factor, partial [Coraliomargarita sp.]